MKKILIGVGILFVFGLAAFFLFANEEKSPEGEMTINNGENSSNTNNSEELKQEIGEEKENNLNEALEEKETFTPPRVTSEDIAKSITDTNDEGEKKFLPPVHQEELKGSALSKSEPIPEKKHSYTISWERNTDVAVQSLLPRLPINAPLYSILRDENKSVFSQLRKMKEDFNLSGAVVRRKENSYSITNISTGEFFLHFDLYHHTFDVPRVNIPFNVSQGENPLELLRKKLKEKNVLQFEETAQVYRFPEEGKAWVRFTPKLPLPLLSLENHAAGMRTLYDENGDKFLFGQLGYVDVELDEKSSKITALYHYFPNIEEIDNISLMGTKKISEVIEKGKFDLATVQLQYPGALSAEQRSGFYKEIKNKNISILEASIDEIECGYFTHDQNKVQHFIAPSCIISGTGKVNGNTSLFSAVLPIAE